MKITREQIRQIIKEELEKLKEIGDRVTIPLGFTQADKFNVSRSELEPFNDWKLKTSDPSGRWNQNNGVLVATDSSGQAHVWIPKADPNERRRVSYEQAVIALQDGHFTEDRDIPVPYSN